MARKVCKEKERYRYFCKTLWLETFCINDKKYTENRETETGTTKCICGQCQCQSIQTEWIIPNNYKSENKTS